MRKINEIIVHCSDTPPGKDFVADDIDRWHKAKGWDMIGYHYVITLCGEVQHGRRENHVGAHCCAEIEGLVVNRNPNSLGICLIGNGADGFSEQQKKSLSFLIAMIKSRYNIKTIKGHSFYNRYKTCPNLDMENFLEAYTWELKSKKLKLQKKQGKFLTLLSKLSKLLKTKVQ